jgi:alpha-mannosidase
MSTSEVHIINHTHWDREWFLTSIYTSRWIPGLIDRLETLVQANPSFAYLLDGQTLVVEDLLTLAPEYEGRVRRLVENGNLLTGPYYCQPDWQITGAEALVRNLVYGIQDLQRLGGQVGTGWLVDTFGHISQSPQIHRLAGIDQVYVWRGVPAAEPYFQWQAPDGSEVLAVYLLGGYRNLYGVTHVPKVAMRRLVTEVERLRPYYPTPEIPLFDGYDLEDNPEDPLQFYQQQNEKPSGMTLVQSTPAQFAECVQAREKTFPTWRSELNSGKYGAIFPGTLSARIYLKLMAADCERLLYRVCEPLAVIAYAAGRSYPAQQYEGWGRALLQNAVHDGICGVSIDTVHEKMEFIYRQVFDGTLSDIQDSLDSILAGFQPGEYAVSTSPFPLEICQVLDDKIAYTNTNGIGVWPVSTFAPLNRPNQPLPSFSWRNKHYAAEISQDGLVRIGHSVTGQLVVRRESGDTYSEESGEVLGLLAPAAPLKLLEKSEWHAVVGFTAEWRQADARVTAEIKIQFDPSPIVRWTVFLNSHGTDMRVDICFDNGLAGEMQVGMPFDFVQRPAAADTDLLPRQLQGDLAAILLGQRELQAVSTFPFQGFVAQQDGEQTAVILARGLRAYTIDGPGKLRLPLRRAVEWVTRAGLQGRVGDAGPFFYVPEARSERTERHELGFAVGDFASNAMQLAVLNDSFQNPPLIVQTKGSGKRTEWQFWQEDVPLTGLEVQDGRTLARIFNPSLQPKQLSRSYPQVDLWGQSLGRIDMIPSKKIIRLEIEPQEQIQSLRSTPVILKNAPAWRVGESTSRPDPAVIALLSEKIAALELELAQVQSSLAAVEGAEQLRRQHQAYILEREMVEYMFSRLLNQRLLARQGPPTQQDLFGVDTEIAELGLRLNQLRIKRRIYDYVVGVI